ncbi:MAG: hypothetical protein H7833_15450 [Magnetococcus sp. DMHC-1]|nr:hypothetical protein [Magnetococcales bacterium]
MRETVSFAESDAIIVMTACSTTGQSACRFNDWPICLPKLCRTFFRLVRVHVRHLDSSEQRSRKLCRTFFRLVRVHVRHLDSSEQRSRMDSFE